MKYDDMSCDVPYLHEYIELQHKQFQWINVKDDLPKSGEFLALINNKIFISKVIDSSTNYYFVSNDYVYLKYEQSLSGSGRVCTVELINPRWVKPEHFAEVTHWYPLPALPKEIK